jgi:hypothetical protein
MPPNTKAFPWIQNHSYFPVEAGRRPFIHQEIELRVKLCLPILSGTNTPKGLKPASQDAAVLGRCLRHVAYLRQFCPSSILDLF